jgi:ubiquinol-cytochrome c reductase cytochrome c subunit
VLGVALLLAAAVGAPATPPPVMTRGAQLYATHCASCHAPQKWGTGDGPSLRAVGMGTLDFYLMTGRMPAAEPEVEVAHRDERSGQALPLDDVRALEAYLAPTVAGGPAIPRVVANGNLDHGQTLFRQNCQSCHGLAGEGGDLGLLDWAPSLDRTSIAQVAEAIRVGPEQMPVFGPQQLSDADVDDVASYVIHLQTSQQPAFAPYRSSGPVPEGALGYIAIVALVIFVFAFWRVDTPPRRREEVVRRDEGESPG